MKKKVVSKISLEPISINIAIMVVFILLGIVVGAVCCFSTDLSLSNLTAFNDNTVVHYSFLRTFFNFFKYPLILFLMGFTILGIFIIPIIVFLKGFFLSFSISSIFKFATARAFSFAFATFGIQIFVSVPCILFLSAISFEFSKNFAGPFRGKAIQKNSAKILPIQYFITFIFLLLLIIIFSFLDAWITPKLISNITEELII